MAKVRMAGWSVTAVKVAPSNGPTGWQVDYEQQARQSRRIAPLITAAE